MQPKSQKIEKDEPSFEKQGIDFLKGPIRSQMSAEQIAQYASQNEQVLETVRSIIDSPTWQLNKEEGDITFYTRSDPGSSFTQVKSIVSVEAPIEKVVERLSVIDTIEPSMPADKRDGVVERRTFDESPNGCFLYIALESPSSLVSKRDFLLFRRHYERDGKHYFVHSNVDNFEIRPAVKGFVRGKMFFQGYIAEKDPTNDKAVRITFFAHADPAGSIPSWVYNRAAVKQGYNAKKAKDSILNK